MTKAEQALKMAKEVANKVIEKYDNKNGKLEITFTFDDLSASYVLELDKFKYKNFNILCDVAESMKRGKK